MADAEKAKAGTDDGALSAVEATEPVVLQEPDRAAVAEEQPASNQAMPAARPERRQSGLLGFVLGGALLAGAGFGVARYVFPDTGSAGTIAALQTRLDAAVAADAKLRSDLAALTERPVPDAGLADRIAALEAAQSALPDISATDARLSALEDRLAAIEASSAAGEGAPAAALAAMDRELKALKAALDAQKGAGSAVAAEIEAATAAAQTRLDAAELAAETAARQAALSHVRAAFESGAPLGSALEGLRSMGADIPEGLATAAEGLPTLRVLQEGFAEPARAALDASVKAEMGDGWADRLSAFLRSQSGARSLTPREGTDPDAVLSRAEAALRSGNLEASLAELAGLPPAGAEAMTSWVADATRRLDAEQAITDLSAAMIGE